jgi:hypothetical protein
MEQIKIIFMSQVNMRDLCQILKTSWDIDFKSKLLTLNDLKMLMIKHFLGL